MTFTTQFKTLFLFAVLFVASTFAISPCKPGYVQPEDCAENAFDPAGGNCWWGYEGGSCMQIYDATSAAECADFCYLCLKCVYDYGCCTEGDPLLYENCYNMCIANM